MVSIHGYRAEFRFFRPQAHRVELMGDFNQWRRGELLLRPTPQGSWRGSIRLPPGDFKFRYVADGQVFLDYAAFGLEPGPFGLDSVVHVGRSNRRHGLV